MFHYLIKEDEFVPVQEVDTDGLDALNSEVRRKIVSAASREKVTVSDIVERMDLDRQTTYYNLKKLESAGILESEGSRPKYYSSDNVAYYYRPEGVRAEENPVALGDIPEILRGFVAERRVTARIVVGAPYPHGENNRKHLTSYKVGELACQLGNYGSRSEQLVYTDVEAAKLPDVPEIAVGGFRVNELTRDIYTEFPVKFSRSGDEILTSDGNTYTGADTGYVIRGEVNGVPKMVVAGISGLGTSAAIKLLASRIEDCGGKGAVVRGYGTKEAVEDIEVLERID